MAKVKTSRGFDKQIRVYLDDELLRSVDGLAAKEGLNRSEMLRRIIQRGVSEDSAVEGIDTVLKLLRNVLHDVTKPQFDRIAKMVAKDTKASAAGMFMQVVEFHKKGEDHVAIYSESMKKAAAYLATKDEES
jgi:metal-responsive CopG/Arc/MetJ family transcriptional regulator